MQGAIKKFLKAIKLRMIKPSHQNTSVNKKYYFQQSAPQWRGRDYLSSAENGYIKNVIANRAINMIAKSVSSCAFIVSKIDEKGLKTEIPNHQIASLLKKPSPLINESIFFESIVSYLMVDGNAFIQIVRDEEGKPSEMSILRPDRVKILKGYSVIPSGYRYTIDGVSFDFSCNEETGSSDILHLKTFNPINDWYGLSPVETAQYSIDQHNDVIKWNRSLLLNGGRPSGALVLKDEVSDTQFENLKEELQENLKGHENSGKIMILQGGFEWKDMGISPRDMDFIQTKNSSARDIAMAFGVPSQLLGIPGDNTYNNISEARSIFWEETVLPLVKNICDRLSNWFSDIYSENIVIECDLDKVSAISGARQTLWDNLKTSTFITDQEKRAMLGFEQNK